MTNGTVRLHRVLRAKPERVYRAFIDAGADRFDDPGLPGEMRTLVELRAVSCGTELTVRQEGIPAMIPLEMCYLGWQESLAQLALLVEPEIPG